MTNPLRATLLLAVLSACGGSTGSTSTTVSASGATVISWFVGATNVQTTVKAGTTARPCNGNRRMQWRTR